MNNVETVTTSEEVTPTSHGSRLCGLTCSIGSYIKSGISAIVPSLATLKTVPAVVIMISLPFILTEMCTKVCASGVSFFQICHMKIRSLAISLKQNQRISSRI